MDKFYGDIAMKCYYMICMCLTVGGFCLNASESTKISSQTEFVVSIGALAFEQDTILCNLNGVWYPVHSLEKRGNQWVAGIDVAINYCPKGDPLCRMCGLCHRSGCYYYVPPCWKRP